jgi:CheY-like chemotaxis protein
MIGTLDVLVVDDRPETVRFLTEFLTQRCRRVDVAASVREATTAITRRMAAKEVYHLIISDFVMPEADGLSFLRELRMRKDNTPFVFATGYRALNPNFEPEAKRLGVLAILDKPIDLKRVEEIIGHATGIFRKQQEEKAGDQPFFGTSRTMRRPTAPGAPPTAPSQALEPRTAAPQSEPAPPPIQMPTTGTWVNPDASALEPNKPPAAPAADARAFRTPQPTVAAPVTSTLRRPSQIIPVSSGTSRIRRSVEPAPPVPGSGRIGRNATPQPPTSFTTRVRRGVEGTASFGRSGATESGRSVACQQCGKNFLVLSKPEAYTTICVHCGQMQRIEPA